MRSIYTVKYCPGVNKNEIIKFNVKQMKKLKTIILTDVPKNQKVKCFITH